MRLIVAALLLTACATPVPQPDVTPAATCHPEVAGPDTPGIVRAVALHMEPPKMPYRPVGIRIVEMDAIVDENGRVVEVCPVRGEHGGESAAPVAIQAGDA